jgi:hypothetical protein
MLFFFSLQRFSFCDLAGRERATAETPSTSETSSINMSYSNLTNIKKCWSISVLFFVKIAQVFC